MKKKTILLSILSIIMCLSLTVGGTFALFTSKSEVNVAVTSGTVKVSASITNTEYSFDSRLTEASNCTYEINANGGLDINQMVPGDSIKATLSIANDSDVAIQYRINTAVSGDLADYLVIEKVTKLWTKVDAKANIADETVVITLPYEVEDAKAQGATASVLITVEAVQANAPVANVNADGETTTDTNLTDNKGNSAVAPAGVDMKDGETTLTLKVEEAQSTNTGNFSFGTASKAYAYEVKVPEVAEDNDEEIIVTMAAPANLENVLMFHEGVAMNPVVNADAVVNHNDFYYDVAGSITFATKSFSNFTVVDKVNLENLVFVSDATELQTALAANDGKEIIFTNDISVVASKGGYNKAGIIVDGDIVNGNGYTLFVSGANATWSCGIYTNGGTIKNIIVSGSFRGIFTAGQSSDINLENVSFANVCYTFNSDDGNGQFGVYAKDCTFSGWTSFSNVHKEVVFTDCKFNVGIGGYAYEFCRPYNATTFNNCIFAEGYEFDTTCASAINFNGCYYGETLITTENAESLATGDVILFYNGIGNAKIA